MIQKHYLTDATAASVTYFPLASDLLPIRDLLRYICYIKKQILRKTHVCMIVEPMAFVSFPSVVHEPKENFKVLGWCSRHKYGVMIIVILNKFAIRCCLLGISKRTGTETDYSIYFMI